VIARMSLGMMLTGLLLAGDGTHWGTPPSARGTGVPQDSVGAPDSRPPAAWLVNDPADSLYRAAREALDRRDYQKAADLFAQVPVRFPKSGYAADSFYWRAFALYRMGGTAQLRTALEALNTQRDKFPKAATQGDAKALALRIQGELARQGDPDARLAIQTDAARIAQPPAPP